MPNITDMQNSKLLHGESVVIAGRLASMTQADLTSVIRSFGGRVMPAVGPRTSVLVIGLESPPIDSRGQLDRKLSEAERLQNLGFSIKSYPEDEFLDYLGLSDAHSRVSRHYSLADLTRLLAVPRDRIRGWIRAGLIEPVATVHRLYFFDFQQVAQLKSLCRFMQQPVATSTLRKSFAQLRKWLPAAGQPLQLLAHFDSGQRPVFRIEDKLSDAGRQLQFDFETERHSTAGSAGNPCLLEEQFELAFQYERAGRFLDASRVYESLVERLGPQPELCFNLGNCFCALRNPADAQKQFQQAVALDPNYVEAWNNLGSVLAELDLAEKAIDAFQRALKLVPDFADTHYNLADTLDQLGRFWEARPHWQTYYQHDAESEWGKHAAARLIETTEMC